MVSVRSRCAPVKGEPPPGSCPVCSGSGRINDDIGCSACDETGRLVVLDGYRFDDPTVRPSAVVSVACYTAFVRGDAVDEGGPLDDFLDGLARDFNESRDDVTVWLDGRCVAVLKPAPGNRLRVINL